LLQLAEIIYNYYPERLDSSTKMCTIHKESFI
jgi:hypothetical protein